MSKRKKTNFDVSASLNNFTYGHYVRRLMELGMAMFEWKNLPKTVDRRFLEFILFTDGQAIYYRDEILGDLCLKCALNGKFNVYGIPTNRRAMGQNGYNMPLDETNSVIIYNNYLHTNTFPDIEMFAMRLYNLDRAIDVNANAQKTPILIQGSEQQRLTLLNVYKEYDGNAPVIFGDKNLDVKGISAIKTDAPYVCDKLYELKTQIWNEALTYLGISNINIQKKERLITDEVTRNQGGTIASRYSRLEARREACDLINDMFKLNISVDYREDFQQVEDGSGLGTIGDKGNE